jgi:hypothetical protein
MRTAASWLMLLSLGLFILGCKPAEQPKLTPRPPGPGPTVEEETEGEEAAETTEEAAAETTEAPTMEEAAPAESTEEAKE